MEYEVAELEGALLDAAVSKAEGWAVHEDFGHQVLTSPVNGDPSLRAVEYGPLSWSTSWAQGGPIIERERLGLTFLEGEWRSMTYADRLEAFDLVNPWKGRGHTPLIAAMRAYVASKFGETIDLP
jgi:hypothetical protein